VGTTNNYEFHTFSSVHFHPSLFYRGSGSETREGGTICLAEMQLVYDGLNTPNTSLRTLKAWRKTISMT